MIKLIAGFIAYSSLQFAFATQQPNIVIIVSDDGGYADFGFSGCKDFKTPAIDSIASSGIKFNNGYVAASVCSPSRAGLLSGKYVSRIGHEFNPPLGDQWKEGLPAISLAERLQKAGYQTAAFGKWHLGHVKWQTPNDRGFDHFWGFLGGSRSYLQEDKTPKNLEISLNRNGTNEKLATYLTDAIGQEAVQYIKKAPNNKPFFAYIAFNCPHSPMQSKPGYEQKFPDIQDKQRRTLAAMQTSLDENVQKILTAIKDRGQWDNTLIWFINDNGAGPYWNFDNAGLRNKKGTLFEGGVKVAFSVSWPQIIRHQEWNKPISSLDIASTSLAAAGLNIPKDLDGINLLPAFKQGEGVIKDRYIYWRQSPVGAIRDAEWKLILIDGKSSLLFNLKQDPYEKHNIIKEEPLICKRLDEAWNEWNAKNIAPKWTNSYQPSGTERYKSSSPWNERATPNFGKLKKDGHTIQSDGE